MGRELLGRFTSGAGKTKASKRTKPTISGLCVLCEATLFNAAPNNFSILYGTNIATKA
jgi:hypothetical protein